MTGANRDQRITSLKELDSLTSADIKKRFRGLARSHVKNWPEEVFAKVVIEENLVLAVREAAADFIKRPTLNGQPAELDDYLGAKLGYKLREVDRRQRPQMYDEDGTYLGAEGEMLEGLTRDPGGDESRDDTRSDGGDIRDEKWVRNVAQKRKKKARDEVSDPTALEAIRAVGAPGEQKSFPAFADELMRTMKALGVQPASQTGVVKIAGDTYYNGGEQLGGRQGAKALGHKDYISRPATAIAAEAANLIMGKIEDGTLRPPPPHFKYHPHI